MAERAGRSPEIGCQTLILLLTALKTVLTEVPREPSITTAATETSAAINAYSIIVAPRALLTNCLMILRIIPYIPFGPPARRSRNRVRPAERLRLADYSLNEMLPPASGALKRAG